MAANLGNNNVFADISQADNMRIQTMQAAWDAFNGKFPKPLKVARNGYDDNIVANRCRPIVDKCAAFLFGKALKFQYADLPASAMDYVQAVWKANRQTTLLRKLALNGGVTGTAMLRILPPQAMRPLPRLIVLDAATVTVVTDPDDIDNVLEYTINTNSIDPKTAEPIAKRQIIKQDTLTSWLIVEQIKSGNDKEWQQIGTDVWPYPFAPILHCQNRVAPNAFWGNPHLSAELIQLNKDLNFILSNICRIIRIHAHPKTIGKGFDASALKIGIDGTIILPNPEATLTNLEMQSDLSSSLALVDRLLSAMDELSGVPSISLGTIKDIPSGQISGVALQVLYEPLIEITESEQELYGEMLLELNRRLLFMEYGETYDEADGVIIWPNLVPSDDATNATVAAAWKSLGVSQQTIYAKLGLDPDQEKALADKEAEEKAKLAPPPPPPMAPPQPGDPNQPAVQPAQPAQPIAA